MLKFTSIICISSMNKVQYKNHAHLLVDIHMFLDITDFNQILHSKSFKTANSCSQDPQSNSLCLKCFLNSSQFCGTVATLIWSKGDHCAKQETVRKIKGQLQSEN